MKNFFASFKFLLIGMLAMLYWGAASISVAIVGESTPLFGLNANAVAAALQLDLILQSALMAFKQTLMPLAMFSTAFYDEPLQGTNIIQVPYYPIETNASIDFNGTYQFPNGTDTQSKPLTINKRKYQPMSYTSDELRRQPRFDPERLGMLKGLKLAEDVLVDVLSLVTNANFGAAVFTGAAATFDVSSVIDLEATLTAAKWPLLGRGVIVKPTYMAGLKKDMNTNGGIATFGRDSNGAVATFPNLSGFSFADSNIIPANGENLTGMAVYRSAILVGFSPIQPTPEVASRLTQYETVTDPDTGITLEYRAWGDADTDTSKRTIEVNYGFAKGEAAALGRIVSA